MQGLTPKEGYKLRMNDDMLRYSVYHNRGPVQKDKRLDVIRLVILKVDHIWENAGIPMSPVNVQYCKANLKKLILQYEDI